MPTRVKAGPDLCRYMTSLRHSELKHWALNKLTDILQAKCILVKETYCMLPEISLIYAPKAQIDK